jgi:hypothetical protein
MNDTLPNWLWKFCCGAVSPALERALAYLFLELSGGDSTKLIENLDYIPGVRLLHAMGMETPLSLDPNRCWQNTFTGGYWDCDPFTGEPRGMVTQPAVTEMTDAERWREAERLSVLVSHLGDVANPVENPIAHPPVATAGSGQVDELSGVVGDDLDGDINFELDGGASPS